MSNAEPKRKPDPPAAPGNTIMLSVVMVLLAGMLYYLRSSGFSKIVLDGEKPTRPDTRTAWEAAGRPQIVLTPEELKEFDGRDMDKPIYLAILGDVFDVTAGANFYASEYLQHALIEPIPNTPALSEPDGGYAFFSGVDASRSYSTGCFETHLTHDIRGLSEKQVKAIKDWRDFFLKSKKYFKVGTVLNPPIDPDSPIPVDCNDPKK